MAPSRVSKVATAALLALALSSGTFAAVSVQTPEDKILSHGFQAYMDGNDKQALSYFEEVIRINPHNAAAQKGVEKVKIRLKKIADAETERKANLATKKMKEGKNL